MTEPSRPRPRPTRASDDTPTSTGPAHVSDVDSVPDGGIAVVLPEPAPPTQPGGKRRPRRPGKVRRFLKTRRGKWTVAAAVAVLALVAGLLSQGFLSPAAPPLKDAQAPDGGSGLSSPAPTPSASNSGAATNGKPATAEDIKSALKAKAGAINNPLNSLRSPGKHTVSITVSSSQPVQVVGYLVPTSINTNYAFGTIKPNRPSWSLNTTAVGKGYLAAVFIQADKTGAPVTCTVSVDGQATNSESTGGPYGRQVCLG